MQIKKRLIILILFLLLITTVRADLDVEDYPYNFEELGIRMNISGNINLTGNLDSVRNLKVDMKQYPKESQILELKYLNPFPDYDIENDSIVFTYGNNELDDTHFIVHAGFNNKRNQPLIKRQTSFPLKNIPEDMQKYLQATENIDINNQIKNKASILVNNEKAVLDAAKNIVDWIENNITYQEDVDTADGVQKSSWVYQNKKGVCDEITSLFISMARSVGIPARFVSGIAYSKKNKEFDNHAWAEIYIPKQGWVSFDITYQEYGWVDSTHIPLVKNEDSRINALECTVSGSSDLKIKTDEINFHTEVIEKERLNFLDIDINITALSTDMGIGYNVIEAELKNNENHVLIPNLMMTPVTDLHILNSLDKRTVLRPYSSAKERWLIKINDSLDENAYYKFPIEIRLPNSNISSKIMIDVSNKGIIYSESYAKNFLQEKNKYETEEYLKDMDIDCEIQPIYILSRETPLVCNITNSGDIIDADACFKGECKDITLKDNTEVIFNPSFKELGLQTHILKITNNNLTKKEYLNFNVKDQPDLKLKFKGPKNVTFDKDFNMQINISKISKNIPKDVVINLQGPGMNKKWTYDDLGIDQVINLKLKGKYLFSGMNSFKTTVTWKNSLKEEFKTEKTINIELVNLNLWESFYAFVNKMINN